MKSEGENEDPLNDNDLRPIKKHKDVKINFAECLSHNLPPLNGLPRNAGLVVGIDEAGRGPVLGPLVYSLFVCPLDAEFALRPMGVQDSKVLTASQRESILGAMKADGRFGWALRVISPQEISSCMLQRGINLNELSYAAVYDLLDELRKNIEDKNKDLPVRGIYVDALGPSEKYELNLTERFPQWKFCVQTKADATFPVVGAASIVAKVTRDQKLQSFPLPPGVSRDFGSGYPSDPQTVKWLQDHAHPSHGFPDVVRFSWSSAERVLQKKGYGASFSKFLSTSATDNTMARNPFKAVIRRGFLQHVNLSFLPKL